MCARWEPNQNGRFRPVWLGAFAQRYDGADSPLPYVAFPFQGENPTKTGAQTPALYYPAGGAFDLVLKYPREMEIEVEAAVWAWVNFGGLGARTRRGCGTLFSSRLAPTDPVRSWYQQKIKGFEIPAATVRDWPQRRGRDRRRNGPTQ